MGEVVPAAPLGGGERPPMLSFKRRAREPSDMAAPSVSVSDPAPPRLRIFADDGSRVCGAEELGTLAGEPGLEWPGVGCVEAKCLDFSFFFLTEASVPEASERFGDPGRFKERDDVDFFMPPCSSRSELLFSLRPDGVLAPGRG